MFDVLFVSASAVQNAPGALLDAQPPVDEPVVLLPSLDLRIDRVDHGLAEQVMTACEPRGTIEVHRQWGSNWGFFRDNVPKKSESEPWAWDPDHAIYSTVALSRLVQPNVISTEYAARVVPTDGTFELHPGPVTGQSSNAWLHESIQKRWLTKADAEALAGLVAAYWPINETLPSRLSRALWNHEFAAQTRDINVRLVIVASALEALVHTDQYRSTGQFCRTTQLAADLGLTFSLADAKEAYSLRSHVAHGDRLASLLPPSNAAVRAVKEQRMVGLLLTMDEILRTAIRRSIETPSFRAVFEDDAHIRARWKI